MGKLNSITYILDENKRPVRLDSNEWSEWMHKQNEGQGRVVKQEHLVPYYLSTVFLGIDHNFGNTDPKKAVLFESMVFLNKSEVFIRRYHSWNGSLKGHEKISEFMREYINSPKGKDIPWGKLARQFSKWREDVSS